MSLSLIKYCAAILLVLPIACKHNIRKYNVPSSINFSIPSEIPLNKAIITNQLQKQFNLHRKKKQLSARVLILSYSSVKEVFSYSEKKSNTVQVKTVNGSIEAMIKIKYKALLIKILFVKASGSSKEELLKNFIHELIKAFQWI